MKTPHFLSPRLDPRGSPAGGGAWLKLQLQELEKLAPGNFNANSYTFAATSNVIAYFNLSISSKQIKAV